MKLCILGWYGSETLGDRAILDGIILMFSKICKSLEINVGSLYTVLTERTIYEDKEFFSRHGKLKIQCFDSRNKKNLRAMIEQSDMVIMGGGPLMDLEELYLILYSFKIAKKKSKYTGLIGCGYGPLNNSNYVKCVKNIVSYSDIVVMRSEKCKEKICKIVRNKDIKKVYASLDPAELSVAQYRIQNNSINSKNEQWIVNLRELKYVYPQYYKDSSVEESCVKEILEKVNAVLLLPNHTFSIGGDDRYILNEIGRNLNSKKVIIQQKPLSLKEMYDVTMLAKGCVGMRYHSVVFQTYLNGNNYIIDYTDPMTGKIGNYLDVIDKNGFYKTRYVNVLESQNVALNIQDNNECFRIEPQKFIDSLLYYRELLSRFL